MTCYQEIVCPECGSNHITKSGRTEQGTQRYRCQNEDCSTQTFLLDYRYKAYMPGVKRQVLEMAINGSGIRDTSRVLGINKNTVISTLKKKKKNPMLTQVNPIVNTLASSGGMEVRLEGFCEAEMDEQWSYVGKKSEQRCLWYAIDHATSTILAYVFGKRKDEVFKQLKALLQPFNIARYYTDDWGAYERYLDTEKHEIGKRNTQKIERKNLNLRTWIKRLTRKTICFSRSALMHDTVIGLLINKVEFGLDIHNKSLV